MRRGLTLGEIAAARRTRGRAALLYLTDRCPVGCAHCSVDALPRGPRPADRPRFRQVLRLLCEEPALSVVGISGGEPFTEPRALLTAARRLTAAGRHIVPYTSGNWAASRPAPPWAREVLRLSSCVILSTDAYHAARLPPAAFVAAARATAAEGTWLACQVLTGDEALAERLLRRAFGREWPSYAELAAVPLLPYGRAAGQRAAPPGPGPAGPCTVAGTPVVRYDGRIAVCCNERVAAGGGPAGLHRSVDEPGVLRALAGDPYLTVLGSLGVGALAALPGYRDLAGGGDMCGTCWRMVARGTGGAAVRALAALTGGAS